MASLTEKIAGRHGDGALQSSFQLGANGEMSLYAQEKVSNYLARAAEQQSQLMNNNLDAALSA